MGGEAAKERRRLKRLAQQQQNENGTVVESASSAVAQEVKKGGGNNALLRLQRKLARKASGKFKPLQGQSQQQASSSHKRKPESNKNRNPAAKSSPAKKFKGGSDHSSQKKRNNVKPAPVSKNMKRTKTKPKKPKHLKRKIEQLSEAMSGGSDVAQLDEQMKKLISQMEEFKKIKGNNSKEEGVVKNQSKEHDVDLAQSSEGSISDAEQVHSNEEKEVEHEKPVSSASDEDSSSDEEDIVEDLNPRSRGKRRRGRRESSCNENSQNEAEDDKATKNTSEVESNKISADKTSVLPHVTDDDETKISKKTSKKDDKRRCIGRKPVTDFVVGECYTGKVQYIKPRLGAFIDIGCHSDAFIHISCISDSYVSSVDEILNVGDEVENARVVSIDREKKRVTLSLRSDDAATESQKKKESNAPLEPKQEEAKKTLSTEYNDTSGPPTASSASPALSTQKTGADLKRERKLARRAARRALQQGE